MTDSPNCFIGYHVHSDTKPLCKAIYVSESSILVQTNFTPTLYTYRAHFGKWRQKTSFQGLLYEILNGFWTQLTAEDDQGMGKDQELFWFWRILLLKKQSSYREVYKLHFSSLMFSVRRYLLSLIQCLAQHRITSLELQKILQLFQYSHISRVRKLERRSNICSTSYRNTCTILIEIGE